MKALFADTSFYVALWNPNDRMHAAASEFSRASSVPVFVTEYVLVELGNFLSRSQSRARFPALVRSLQRDPHTIIISASSRLLGAGLRPYEGRPDKEWSLTDCISFVVMLGHGLTEALTTDHHFEQAGFKALLKQEE